MLSNVTVKVEKPDDVEINQLAKEIAAKNQVILAQSQNPTNQFNQSQQKEILRPGQPGIKQFFIQKAAPVNEESTAPKRPAIDEESRKGRFGWTNVEGQSIPYILRNKSVKYLSLRVSEQRLLNNLLRALPGEVANCCQIPKLYITEDECKLLNEINFKHCDGLYGKEPFTSKELICPLDEVVQFFHFLQLCHKKLILKRSDASDRCGFLRIDETSAIPYINLNGNKKYLPMFYFEGETDHVKHLSVQVSGWDLAYLKFCGKVQGIREDLFRGNSCEVTLIDEIKNHFPDDTKFENYWPDKVCMKLMPPSQPAGSRVSRPQPAPAHIQSQPQQSQILHHEFVQQIIRGLKPDNSFQSLPAFQSLQPFQNVRIGPNGQIVNTVRLMPSMQSSQTVRGHRTHVTSQSSPSLMGRPNLAMHTNGSSILPEQSNQNVMPSPPRSSAPASNLESQPSLGGLTQIKDFPYEKSSGRPPYGFYKALIHQKCVPCLNVRPFSQRDLLMTLPDFVTHLYPMLTNLKAKELLQDTLRISLYKANRGQAAVLKAEGKCVEFDPVPLILVKDVMAHLGEIDKRTITQSRYEPPSKRSRVV